MGEVTAEPIVPWQQNHKVPSWLPELSANEHVTVSVAERQNNLIEPGLG